MSAACKCFISISGFMNTKFFTKYLKDEKYIFLGLLIHGDFGMRNVKAGKWIMTNNFRITFNLKDKPK